jgi:hypothetical protein
MADLQALWDLFVEATIWILKEADPTNLLGVQDYLDQLFVPEAA